MGDRQRYPTESMMFDTANPYASTETSGGKTGSKSGLRLRLCVLLWIMGTFSLSAVSLVDAVLPIVVSGRWIDVAFLFMMATAVGAPIAAPITNWERFMAFIISVALFICQFIIIATISIALNGLDGTQ